MQARSSAEEPFDGRRLPDQRALPLMIANQNPRQNYSDPRSRILFPPAVVVVVIIMNVQEEIKISPIFDMKSDQKSSMSAAQMCTFCSRISALFDRHVDTHASFISLFSIFHLYFVVYRC